jgi:hemerythrin
MGFLQDWLAHHIMNEDMQYKAYLADGKNQPLPGGGEGAP